MTSFGAWGRFLPPVILFLLPTLLYWNTISHRYGFRDDYSILREAHEEPGKILRLCSAQARPVYGFLLERSFAQIEDIDDLRWMRLLSAGLLGGLAVLLYFVFVGERWSRGLSALVAGAVPLLPGAQVAVAWAVAWPPVFALLLSAGGYACAERAFRATALRPRLGAWAVGLLLVVASALTYQASSLFYVVPLAAGLSVRLAEPWRETVGWLTRHVTTLGLGMIGALSIAMTIFAWGGVEPSSRVALASDVGETLHWFIHAPLANALAVFALKGTGAKAAMHAGAVMLAVTILAAGMIRLWKKTGWQQGMLFTALLVIFPLVAYAVNLLSTERAATYRTMIPLTALILVLLAASLRQIAGRRTTAVIFSALAAAGAWTAHRQPFDLIARPQSIELALVEAGATRINLTRMPRIFIITPMLAEAPAPSRYADEFGSLSTDSDWVPREMLAAALQRLFGDVRGLYTCESGRSLPPDRHYDAVIDLSRLRDFQVR